MKTLAFGSCELSCVYARVCVFAVYVPAYFLKTMNQEFRNDSPMRLIKWIVSLANSIIFLFVLILMVCQCFLHQSLVLLVASKPAVICAQMLTKYSFSNCLFILNLNISERVEFGLGRVNFYACAIYIILSDDFFGVIAVVFWNINYALLISLPPIRVCANNCLRLEFFIAILECCSLYAYALNDLNEQFRGCYIHQHPLLSPSFALSPQCVEA